MMGGSDVTGAVGSLFSGVGLLDLAVERALGTRTVWHVERDAYRRAVLRRHWPDAAQHDDVCTVGAHNLAPVAGIVGGFPCRGASSAGPRNGLAHAETGLWREHARILRELRPAWAIVENVAGLETRGLADVLRDFDAMGMHTRRGRLAAADVGAPHRRERLWILAYRGPAELAALAAMANADTDGREGFGAPHDGDGRDAPGHDVARRGASVCDWPPGPDPFDPAWERWIERNPGSEPAVHRGAFGCPRGLDARRRRARLAALGDGVCVPQAVAAIRGLILA